MIPALTLAALAKAADGPQANAALEKRARALHARLLVLDSHTDILLPETVSQYGEKDGTSHTSLAKLKSGGVSAVVFALAVGPGPRDAAGVQAARAEVNAKRAAIDDFIRDSGGSAALASKSREVEALHKAGKIAIIPGFLNARSLGSDLGALDELYRQGVRVLGLTHAGNNDWADSSRPGAGAAEEHGGLSPLGKQAIPRLNDLGIIVDVSQLTTAGLTQVLQLTRAPVLATHSGVRALVDSARNLSDAEIDAIGRNGGAIHVPAFNAYLSKAPADSSAPRGKATVSNLVDQIDYIVKRIGIDHVGIGTDFNHGAGIEGFQSEADAPNVTIELVARGYTEAQIRKIWGGNFLRVWRAAEAARRA
jgi:membrane dipeptidase